MVELKIEGGEAKSETFPIGGMATGLTFDGKLFYANDFDTRLIKQFRLVEEAV